MFYNTSTFCQHLYSTFSTQTYMHDTSTFAILLNTSILFHPAYPLDYASDTVTFTFTFW
ncbi:hypothetical protein BDW72DRAFT_167804 [Aspergillus terricola var. indicus]